jgi:hypothetical protein
MSTAGRTLLVALGIPLLALQLSCGGGEKPVLRAYDTQNQKLVVLTGENVKPKNFYEDADFVVMGGGIGGIAAAVTLCAGGRTVIIIEETDRIAGCLTPGDTLYFPGDDFVDTYGTSKHYRMFRDLMKEWYAKKSRTLPMYLSGDSSPGGFCFTTEAAIDVIDGMLEKYQKRGSLTILFRHKTARVIMNNRRVASVIAIDLDKQTAALIRGWAYIDASPGADLVRMAGVKCRVGAESRSETGEPHAPERADSLSAVNVLFSTDRAAFGENVPGDRAVLDVTTAAGTPPKDAYVFREMVETPRIRTKTPVTELDVSALFQKGPRARFFKDSVGIGYHPIILDGPGGTSTVVSTKPFQIPLSALIPPEIDNLFAVGGAIGTTHVAAGAYETPQIEWACGEVAGYAAAYCAGLKTAFGNVVDNPATLRQLQFLIVKALGAPIYWYDDVKPDDPDFADAQLKPFDNPGYHDAAKTLHYHN